ncbi:class I SAM-dependent RNA methyltransferase [Allorhizocola rhizosphaerae]|uniref:class I SAM-dependent RNA methyltransferase n=1 Tax=Allorhizocola rhizosphaerae TaxID=1872709 RepID=UPI000E3C9A95|nr:TRAM domain-containing protein [Allorhizocola rhizosphaerae]
MELVVGAPAHGGHCVARHEGQVVFVRHALPGERVIAEVTEEHKGYLRADAVEILEASPDRVPAPCPYARPDLCGGCDLQHASPRAQLEWKTAVLREQLQRLARLGSDVSVEALPGDGFGWRTRVRYRVAAAGYAGLLKHRSNEVVPIDRCLIAHPSIQELPVLARQWPDVDVIDVVKPSEGPAQVVSGQAVRERAAGREFELGASAFWQVHPDAADTLAATVVEFLRPEPHERAWDLYGGAGLFSAALGCSSVLVEASPEGAEAARRSLADLPVTVIESTVERALGLADARRGHAGRQPAAVGGRPRRDVRGHEALLHGQVDIVVLDPPRTGVGARVVKMIHEARPRAVAYVACDPAAFARDLRTFLDLGWKLGGIRAYDLFPQTHHFETVALLEAPGS